MKRRLRFLGLQSFVNLLHSLESMSSISETFTSYKNFKLKSVICCFVSWVEIILIPEELKTSQRE